MKKVFVFLSAVLIAAGVFVFSGCEKNDIDVDVEKDNSFGGEQEISNVSVKNGILVV